MREKTSEHDSRFAPAEKKTNERVERLDSFIEKKKKRSSLTGMRSGYLSLILLDSAWRFSVGECEVEREESERRWG